MAGAADRVASVPSRLGTAASEKIAGPTGEGNAGLAAATDVGIQAIPALLGVKGVRGAPGALIRGTRALNEMVADQTSRSGWQSVSPSAAPEVGPTEPAPSPAPSEPLTLAPGEARPASVPPIPESPAAPLSASGTPRAKPYIVPEGPPPKFEEVSATAPEGKTLAPTEQSSREQILKKIGLDEVRHSAITGDAQAAATDYQTSKLDNAAGNHLRNVIDKEREALSTYGENLVRNSGGSIGTDQSALHSRGATIVEPLDQLKEHFDEQTKKLYQEADRRAGDVPIDTPETHKLVTGDQAEFLGTVEGEALLRGVKARMKSLGMADKDGNPLPVTVKQAEQFKQYLNNQWQPRTSRLIRQMKDSIDDDVTKAAGTDIYQQARASRALRSRILDDPKGIAKIMDSSGPDEVNRAVATEKIPDTIASMPVAQFKHIVKTLNEVPEDMRFQAQSAINEIRAHFANRVAEAGNKTQSLWNAKGVTQYLNANSARMAQIFSPEEMANFKTLNDAGHILKKDQSYPGAAVQEHNLVRAGAMQGIRTGATAAGASVAGPVGAAVGGFLGDKLATRMTDKAVLKAAQGRTRKLSDLGKPSTVRPGKQERQ